MTTFCLCMVAFASKTMAQTDVSYTDPSGVTATYQYGNGDAWMIAITNFPASVTKWVIPEFITFSNGTFPVTQMLTSIQSNNLPANNTTLTEIVFPRQFEYVGGASTFHITGQLCKFTNLRKLTFGEKFNLLNARFFEGQPLDTIVFLGSDIIQNENNKPALHGGYQTFNNCPSTTKIIVPCGKLDRFVQSFIDNEDHWQTAPVTWTTANFEEAECLNTLTVLSSDVSLGNAISQSSGSILTTTTPDNTSTTFSGTATLYALPKADIVFTGWSDGNLDNPRTVTVSSDTTFTANFAECEGVGTQSIVIDENTVSIYPNPAKNSLHIQSTFAVEQLIIYDINGRLLKQIANPTQDINISNLAKGTYLVKVKTPVGEVTRTIIKE